MGYNIPEMDNRRKKKHAKAKQPHAYEPQTEKEAEQMAELAEERKQQKSQAVLQDMG